MNKRQSNILKKLATKMANKKIESTFDVGGSVMQFKITLNDIRPAIWRRIQVPASGSILDLQMAIMDAMGWSGYHLYGLYFYDRTTNERTSIMPKKRMLDEFWDDNLDSKEEKIVDWYNRLGRQAVFTYDFGDSWDHTVVLEKILPIDSSIEYPVCLAGARACPPEDCGSAQGYDDLLEIIKNPKHKEYKETMEWLGGEYDPEHFDVEEVEFGGLAEIESLFFY